ncbi:MAG: phage integrase N-terminal SAM-like domain-containing protein [Gammaproteobacteria bacterium]
MSVGLNCSHLKEPGKQKIERFLSHLSINREVAVCNQNQSLNAILFLYKKVLKHSSRRRSRPIFQQSRKNSHYTEQG